ncbi:energy transducer TonB [Halopseudomonas xiamenensis]|uniref:energy transducer TonB n=1 Tax=Halopseudomonas xiamenensis TaxID=157792 RepID=UPI0016282AD0|nr:energy transducer TonB [Halopseudomonas xiamenensis]
MSAADEYRPWTWPVRLLVIGASLALHAALVAWLMSSRFSHPPVQLREPIAVELVELPVEPEPEPIIEPEPEPEPEPETEPEPEPAPKPAPPRPVQRTAPAAAPAQPAGPPVHTFGANQDWAPPPAPPTSTPAATRGRPVPSAYADTVKSRVTANLKRPEGSVYKPPPGYKGDPNDFKRQCYIPYEITVDATGRMLSYVIDRCGDELLDAAAEQAVRSAGPFPPPPNQGAEQYVIYGTAIFIK